MSKDYYTDLAQRLREDTESRSIALITEAAEAIEELSAEVGQAERRLCDWCQICPVDRRDLSSCEIAGLYDHLHIYRALYDKEEEHADDR